MKKLKSIFMLISTLLVLLSSSVLAIIDLDDLIVYYNDTDYCYEFYTIGSSGTKVPVTQEEIYEALIDAGFEPEVFLVEGYVEYKTSTGALKDFSVDQGTTEPFDGGSAASIYSWEVTKKLFDYDTIGTDYYKYSEYLNGSDHNLYFSIYVDGELAKSIKISCNPAYDSVFQAHCEESTTLGRLPTLNDFVTYGSPTPTPSTPVTPPVVPQPSGSAGTSAGQIYTLDIEEHGINSSKTIPREYVYINYNQVYGYYTSGPLADVNEMCGDILFKVTKSGTYYIQMIYKDPDFGPINQKDRDLIYIAQNGTDPTNGNPFVGSLSNGYATVYPIMDAGKEKENVICEHDSCKNANVPAGDFYDIGGYYPLVAGQVYAISPYNINRKHAGTFPNIHNLDVTIRWESQELAEIKDHREEEQGITKTSQKDKGVKHLHGGAKTKTLEVNALEKLLAFFVRCMANGMIYTTNSALGKIDTGGTQQIVSIDSIIFDEYPLTKLNLFTSSLKPGESRNEFIQMFADNINLWFNNFTMIAVVAYLGILLYMGIRVVMSSTAANQALYKEVFLHWVTGVIILFMFPIVIKYAIEINTTFVGIVKKAIVEEHGSDSIDNSEAVNEIEDPDESSEIATTDTVTVESNNISQNPYSESDTGYMAVMAKRAHKTERLSYAFVYLIMSFQLMIIAIMYYKRLFMVAFLIVLFPIVMVVHVLEKVGNIRMGGAFGKWTKEILIMIFTQSIHAIVYSFSIATVMAAGNANNDWVLMLVGVTFLFNGEEILKKILGQSSEVAPSLAKSAAKTAATVMAVKAGTKRLTDNVVGVGSHLSKGITAIREAKTYRKKEALVGKFGEKPKEYKMPPASELSHFKPEYTEFGDTEAIELGNAIQVLNHRELATPDQLRHALDVVGKAKQTGKHKELLKDLKMSDTKFKALNNAIDTMATDAVSGHKTKEQIDAELTMELERIFPNEDIRSMKYMAYAQIGNPLYKNPTQRDAAKVRGEVDDARGRYKKLRDRINIADAPAKDTKTNKELEERAVKLLHDVYGAKDFYSKEQYQMALSVAMLQNSASGRYDAKELMISANYVFNNQGNNKQFKRMASAVGVDIGEYRTVLADSIARKAYGENYQRADNRQANSEGRLDDARRMADKVLKEGKDKEARKRKVGAQKVTLNVGQKKGGLTDSGPKTIEVSNDDAPEDSRITVTQLIANDIPAEGESISGAEMKMETLVIEEEERRERWSTKSKTILKEFSKEMTDKNKGIFEKKFDGMTREELHEMAKVSRSTARKEIEKTVATTAYSALLAGPGAAIAIGASDDEGIITEALAGGLGGAVIGDTIVEKLTEETHTKKVKMRNPYTGEMEEVEITVTGAFRDDELSMANSEFAAAMSTKLKGQFLKNKLARDQQFEDAKQARLQNEQTKKRLDESYKKAMEEATRRNNTGNPPDTNA